MSAKWNADPLLKEIEKTKVRAMSRAGEFLLDESNKIVPLDESPLMKSGMVDVAKDGSLMTVSYNTPYAVRQHEVLYYNHPNGREAKFLESTFKEDGPRAMRYVEREMKKAFR